VSYRPAHELCASNVKPPPERAIYSGGVARGLYNESWVAARLGANGWEDLMELVAQSLARDALLLTVPAA
jgi:hypothetical protein